MEDNALYLHIITACELFYQTFGVLPEKVGVHPSQQHLLPYTTIHHVLPIDSHDAQSHFKRACTPVEPYYGISWGQFVLYSEKFGTFKPEDLALTAARSRMAGQASAQMDAEP